MRPFEISCLYKEPTSIKSFLILDFKAISFYPLKTVVILLLKENAEVLEVNGKDEENITQRNIKHNLLLTGDCCVNHCLKADGDRTCLIQYTITSEV